MRLRVPGLHQVSNALAAAAAADACGLPMTDVLRGLSRFSGTGRRMELRGRVNGADVYDDYGHHPTEIAATLSGARALVGTHEDGTPGRLLCVFQPHTYSRLALLYPQFLTAFDAADRVLLIDVYAARETDTMGVSSEGLARDLGARGGYCPTPASAADALRSTLRAGDVAVVMGAGDVVKVTRTLFG